MSQFFISSNGGGSGSTDLHVARYIVASNTVGTGANYTSIASAITDAQLSGVNSTIAIQPGTYTENLTLPAGINIVAYDADALTPNVTIVGKITCSGVGSRSISGIRLQTNNDNVLFVSGSGATVVNLDNCYINCTNAIGIRLTSTSPSAKININNCSGDIANNSYTLYSLTGNGSLNMYQSNFLNSALTTVPSEASSGIVDSAYCNFYFPLSFTSNSGCTFVYCQINVNSTNTTAVSLSNVTSSFKWCIFVSGTASAINVSGSTNEFINCSIYSTNSNVITGSGSIQNTPFAFNLNSNNVIASSVTKTPLQIGPSVYCNAISFDNGSNILSKFVDWTAWTPTIVGQTTAGVSSYSLQQGIYCRIGSVVILQFNLAVSAATGTGNINIANFPYNVSTDANYIPMGSIMITGSNVPFPASRTSLSLRGLGSSKAAVISACGSSQGEAFVQMVNASMGFHGTLVYKTNDS